MTANILDVSFEFHITISDRTFGVNFVLTLYIAVMRKHRQKLGGFKVEIISAI